MQGLVKINMHFLIERQYRYGFLYDIVIICMDMSYW
jgi:hypothetical protein